MASKRQTLTVNPSVITTFLILAAIAFMSLASEVLKPLALAVLLSFALAPISKFFEQRGVPRFLSVVLTLLLAIGVMGFVSYKVGEQIATLAQHINPEELQKNIEKKFRFLKPREEGAVKRLLTTAGNLAKSVDSPPTSNSAVPVNVVTQPSFTQRLQSAVGPYLESAGVGAFVLVLVLFILSTREDLNDRVIRLVGQGRVSLTTKTMEEVGRRISRYLIMFATVNSMFGLIVSIGLWAIGVPLAAVWGLVAALLRFIPYVGPATAFALPLAFSVASFEGWREPLLVVALFAALEVVANSFVEPVVYGKTTGVTALGLLVAAMFWTWLWGMLGLLLSTPLTVCLAVLGKSVPSLKVFSILLGEDPPLSASVRFYQRLLVSDFDEAQDILEEAFKEKPVADVFDDFLVPTLSRVERDYARGELEMRDRALILRFISDVLDDLEVPTSPATDLDDTDAHIVGVKSNNKTDVFVLRMLGILLKSNHLKFQIIAETSTPLKLAEMILELEPRVVVVSHLPPGGFTTARYLVRRLRARFNDLPILVGRWGEIGDSAKAATKLEEVGASKVVDQLKDALDSIIKQVAPEIDEKANELMPPSSPPEIRKKASTGGKPRK